MILSAHQQAKLSPANERPLLLRDLRKTYPGASPVEALRGVSFEVKPGEVYGLLGPNGAGKTTLISIVVTLEQASSGQVDIFGHAVKPGRSSAKWFLGHVPQELIAYGYFSVEEILHFYSGFYGIWKNAARITYLLKKLSLYEHREKKVKQLSGGMKRRLLIAKALLHSPRLLLLDEPTAGVDLELRSSLWEFVRELRSEGVSILLTTHYIQEAEELCDRVAILQAGQIQIEGPTTTLVRDLTQREIVLLLQKPLSNVEDLKRLPHFVSHIAAPAGAELVFKVPRQMELGQLLQETRLEVGLIRDVQIREGRLEDAIKHVLSRSHT